MYGDPHYGTEFELFGLYGETLNKYSPEIFESRMWDLFNQTVDYIQKNNITKLYVFDLGDVIEGLLRVSQIWKLRYGVVDSAILYGKFMANWLKELSFKVNIEFQMVDGNHSELRMINQPKGTFKEDNLGKVSREIIEIKLENNPNFRITKNPTGLIFDKISNLNVLGIHGEVKDMSKAIKDFSSAYKTQIDILVGAHLHHNKSECVAVASDTVNIPSIIGVDDYSMSLNKTSNAGATIIGLEEGKGVVSQENIKLN